MRSGAKNLFLFSFLLLFLLTLWQIVYGISRVEDHFHNRLNQLVEENRNYLEQIFATKTRLIEFKYDVLKNFLLDPENSASCAIKKDNDCLDDVVIMDDNRIFSIHDNIFDCGQKELLKSIKDNYTTIQVGHSVMMPDNSVFSSIAHWFEEDKTWLAICVEIDVIQELWAQSDLPNEAAIAIVKQDDFHIWLREPFSPDFVNKDISDGPLAKAIKSKSRTIKNTANIIATRTDSVARTVQWMPVGIDDLLLVVGYPQTLPTVIWKEHELAHTIFICGFVIILLITILFSWRIMEKANQQEGRIFQQLNLAALAGEVGVFDYNFNDDTLEWNAQMFDIYGKNPASFGGQFNDWKESVHPDDLAIVENILNEARKHGRRFRTQFRIKRGNGDEAWIGAIAEFSAYVNDTPQRLVGVNMDITNILQSQQQLAKLLERSQEINSMKTQFLANLHHELRTPLNAILGYSQVLLSESSHTTEDSKHSQYIKDIYSSGVHLTSLIENMLDLAQIEQGDFRVEEQVFEINGLIKEVTRMAFALSEKKSPNITVKTENNSEMVKADVRATKQILINLLSNSLKFSFPDKKIVIELQSGAEFVRVSVHDNGQGISPERLERIGKPFNTLPEAALASAEGMGLGLAISRRLTEQMGGTFTLESKVGIGTSVSFTLPVANSTI